MRDFRFPAEGCPRGRKPVARDHLDEEPGARLRNDGPRELVLPKRRNERPVAARRLVLVLLEVAGSTLLRCRTVDGSHEDRLLRSVPRSRKNLLRDHAAIATLVPEFDASIAS